MASGATHRQYEGTVKNDAANNTGSWSGAGASVASKPSIDVACWKASSAWPTAYAATAAAPPLITIPKADSATGWAVNRAFADPRATRVEVVTRQDAMNIRSGVGATDVATVA